MSEVKDASYYLKNPDELTGLSDAELDALAYPAGSNEGETISSAATPDSTSTASETPAEPTGDVLSRDGKHTIPFSVLETARAKAQAETQARQEAEARVVELQELAARLEAQVNAAKTGDEAPAASSEESTIVSQEEIDVLREDFPALAKVLEVQMATVSKLQDQLATVSKAEQARQADAERNVQASVQELIDANPKLLHLQTNDPEGWTAAVAMDDMFKSNPKFAELGTAERFNKVVAAYEAAHGNIAAPQSSAQTSPSKQSKASTVPVSMSAIPGGTPPAVDEAAALMSMNGTQATAHFSKMSREQIEAALNRL